MKCICGYESNLLSDEQILDAEKEAREIAKNEMGEIGDIEDDFEKIKLRDHRAFELMKEKGALPFFPFIVSIGVKINPNFSEMGKEDHYTAYCCPACRTLKMEEFNPLEIQHAKKKGDEYFKFMEKMIDLDRY